MDDITLLRVRDWDSLYENNRTRSLKKLGWVPVPNRHDGDGYSQLVEHPAGAAHFGAWSVIIQVASRCDPRGTLIRDNGAPHTAASIARMTRISAEVFDAALPRLVEIGWLEAVENTAISKHPSAGIPHDDAPQARTEVLESRTVMRPGDHERKKEVKGSEGNGMQGMEPGAFLDPPHDDAGQRQFDAVTPWDDFRANYPECRRIEQNRAIPRAIANLSEVLTRDFGNVSEGFSCGGGIGVGVGGGIGVGETPCSSDDERGAGDPLELVPPKTKHVDDVKVWFDGEFWPAYPRKVGKPQALKTARRYAKTVSDRTAITDCLRRRLPALREQFRVDGDFRPYPSTWLAQEPWNDPEDVIQPTAKRTGVDAALDKVYAELQHEQGKGDAR